MDHRILNSFCIITLTVLFHLSVEGATYLVGPGRANRDLQSVAPFLRPGDVVEVDGNAIYPGGVVFTEPGTAADPITIRGILINEQKPVLNGGKNTLHFQTAWPYSGPGADHYILEGFDITGGTQRGIFHQAAHLVIRDCVVHDCPAHGILGADEGSGSLTLEGVEVYRCGAGDTKHQIYVATDEANRPRSLFRMQFCWIHDGLGGNNVKSRAERNEIYYNRIEGAYYHELELIGPDGQDPRLAREDADVVGNVFQKRNNFYVVRVGGDGTGETNGRYRFVNNTFLCGEAAVFRLFDGLESIEMHNNVFRREGAVGTVDIMRKADAVWAAATARIAGRNNWVQDGAVNIPGEWQGTVRGKDPGFENERGGILRPTDGSSLIDGGTNDPASPAGSSFLRPLFPPAFHPQVRRSPLPETVEMRPFDGRIDIGAYEAGGILIVRIPPPTRRNSPDRSSPRRRGPFL